MNILKTSIYVIMSAFIYGYRVIKSFVPGISLTILFVLADWRTWGTILIVFVVLLGGLFHEFNLTDFVRENNFEYKI